MSQLLSTVPTERALDWVARMIAPNFRGREAARSHEILTARTHFTQGPADMKALDLVVSRERQLFATHILLYLGRLALLHGSDKRTGDHENPRDVARYERVLMKAMLVAAHHAGARGRTDKSGAGEVEGNRPAGARASIEGEFHARDRASFSSGRAMAGLRASNSDGNRFEVVTAMDLELAANIMANRKPYAPSSFHRSERRWIELPDEDANSDAIDLAAEYEAATGAKFADLRMIGAMLWARTAGGGAPHLGKDYFSGLGLAPDRIAAVLRLISADVPAMQAMAQRAAPSEYDSSLFSQFPLVECYDGSFIIMNEAMLVERTLGWLPRHDLEALARSGVPDGKRRAAAAVNYLRTTTERHAVETVRGMVNAEAQPGTLYDESDIQRAYGTGRPNADIAIIWPESIAVVEISSRTIMRGTATGSAPEAFLKDLNLGVLKKVTQIHSTINDIRSDLAALTVDGPADAVRRFWPILVTTEGWPVTPRMTERIRAMLASKDLLQRSDLGPLNIVDIEGLEAAEAVIERTGRTLPSLLQEHQSSPLSSHGFRDWLLTYYAPVRPTARIMTSWDRVLIPALETLETAAALDAGILGD